MSSGVMHNSLSPCDIIDSPCCCAQAAKAASKQTRDCALLAHPQVQELFELGEGSTTAFQPATSRQLVAALLAGGRVQYAVVVISRDGLAAKSSICAQITIQHVDCIAHVLLRWRSAGLRDAHWATACGSRPEPALLTPLTPATALALDSSRPAGPDAKRRRPLAPYALARALAAAERRCTVIPDDWWASASSERSHMKLLLNRTPDTSCTQATCVGAPRCLAAL